MGVARITRRMNMKNSTVETLIGAAVIVIAFGFFIFAYNTSDEGNKAGGYQLTAEFDNIEGVNIGTDIRMAGIKIGTVTAQSLNPENYQALVTMSISPTVKLTDDTSAKVTSEGLLGSKFIALEAGGSDTQLAEGLWISGRSSARPCSTSLEQRRPRLSQRLPRLNPRQTECEACWLSV